MGILFVLFFSCRAEIAFGYTCFSFCVCVFSLYTTHMVARFVLNFFRSIAVTLCCFDLFDVCVNVLWPSLFDGSVFASTASPYQRLTMSIFIFVYFLVYYGTLCFIIYMRAYE